MAANFTAALTRVGTIQYYVPSRSTSLPASTHGVIMGTAPHFSEELVPITLFVLECAEDASRPNLRSTVRSWLQADDVYNKDFLQHIYLLFLPKTKEFDLDKFTISVPEEWEAESVHAVAIYSNKHQISYRGGPYFASGVGTNFIIRQAWRLFDDTNEAFQFPVVPDEQREHTYVFRCSSNKGPLPDVALLIIDP